jgi:hypothetical protein
MFRAMPTPVFAMWTKPRNRRVNQGRPACTETITRGRPGLGECGEGFEEHGKVVVRAPEPSVEKSLGRRDEGEAVVGLVVPTLGVLVDVRGLHDPGLLHRDEAVADDTF